MKLTVYYDGQFWVGVAEETSDGRIKAIKHIFGAEPQDEEVLIFVNQYLLKLFKKAVSGVPISDFSNRRINPKRLAREVAREVKSVGISTYAQQAIQMEYGERKKIRQIASKEEKELAKERKWQLKQKKAKAKHRGH